MKKTLAVIALILIIGIPVFAAATGEILGMTVAGAASGASMGAWAGPGGIVIGALIGAIAGNIGAKAEIHNRVDGQIDSLTAENAQLVSDIGDQELALSQWQDEYDSSIAKSVNDAQTQLNALKENWGLTNTVLASQNRGGKTAQLLSQQQKDAVVNFAGEDMKIDGEGLKTSLQTIYDTKENYDSDGNLTNKALEEISKLTSLSKVGTAGIDLKTSLLESLQGHSNAKKTLSANKQALANNRKTVKNLNFWYQR